MTSQGNELCILADALEAQREGLLQTWRKAVRRDPALTAGEALPRTQLNDHIPAVLAAFEQQLRTLGGAPADTAEPPGDGEQAAAHGLHRWQQGYDLHEVVRELGLLNEVMVAQLEDYAQGRPDAHVAMPVARKAWAATYTRDVQDSSTQYFRLQQQEAEGHVRDLEAALHDVSMLDLQRSQLWEQVAHDLRSNVGVVANVTHGLGMQHAPAQSREKLLRMLDRNVQSLRHLLDDVTELAKLHAGREHRQLTSFDAAQVITHLCEGLQALANDRGLYLHLQGPGTMPVEGDALKLRRIAQNLVLNALKYTQEGGVTVKWALGDGEDQRRWMLSIGDTGPGMEPAAPLVAALKHATDLDPSGHLTPAASAEVRAGGEPRPGVAAARYRSGAGEGIGLSIVKRLAELLDATIEVQSAAQTGTTFLLLFPLRYADE